MPVNTPDKIVHPWKTYYLKPLTTSVPARPGKKVIYVRTRAEWERRGMKPKDGARGLRLPHIPHSAADLHITNELVFDETQVQPISKLTMPESMKYAPMRNLMHWQTQVFYKQGHGAARKRKNRDMDRYVLLPSTNLHVIEDDIKAVSPKRKIIYPPSLFKRDHRKVKTPTKRKCADCNKSFLAKRSDAVFCSSGCRQRAKRRRQECQENSLP